MMTIEEALSAGQGQLHGLDLARFEAEVILAHILARDRSYLRAFPEYQLTNAEHEAYLSALKARAQGQPFAYICGTKEFYDLTLNVTSATLIPRPDTELLVTLALEKIAVGAQSVIDLGTGSGAIALSLKKHQPHIAMTASDSSHAALLVAQENAKKHQLAVTFVHSDWFAGIAGDRCFDLIISNPPYIDSKDPHLLGDGVKYEPLSALVAEDEGYADLLKISAQAPAYLAPRGWLMLEHGAAQGARVRAMLEAQGFMAVKTYKDLAKNERVSCGQWPH